MRSLVEAFNASAIEEYDRLAEKLSAAKGKEKARIKAELEDKFGGVRPESRRPSLVAWQGYSQDMSETVREIQEGPFDPNFLVLTKEEGPALGIEATLRLTSTLRNAAMKAAGSRLPEWLSGHDDKGSPSRQCHAAFFPLPFVGSQYADAHVLGLGIALPKNVNVRQVLGPLFFDTESGEERSIKLWSKQRGWEWELRREIRERPPLSLQRATWTRDSRKWASVTPVVLHHYPKKNRDGDLQRIVREAFISAEFPEPELVEVGPVSMIAGAGHAMSVPPFSEGGEGLCRYQTHVVAHFQDAVRGPMLVGRGRFRGYGLFRPISEETGQ
jgi:CRISPR-associated protein Csb2